MIIIFKTGQICNLRIVILSLGSAKQKQGGEALLGELITTLYIFSNAEVITK
jgi:hypothetical protein